MGHKALNIERDVAIAHYSGPRVKPWKVVGDLDLASIQRLLNDDTIREQFGRKCVHVSDVDGNRRSNNAGSDGRAPPEPRHRVMDGVLIVEEEGDNILPA